MISFNVNQIEGKNIIGLNNSISKRNGLINWTDLGPILNIPSFINNVKIDEISNYAFYNSSEIEEVNIGNGIRQINKYSFAHCHNLKSFVIPPSIGFIGHAGIHCYNESAEYAGKISRDCTSKGTLIVTFLPESKVYFIDDFGISRKEDIVIYYMGKNTLLPILNVFGNGLFSSVKVYSPYVASFIGKKTIRSNITKCGSKRRNNVGIFFAIMLMFS